MGAGLALGVRARQGEDGIHKERWPNVWYGSWTGARGEPRGGSIRHGAGPKQGKEGVHEEEQPGGQFQSPRRIRKAFAQRRRLQQRREIGY